MVYEEIFKKAKEAIRQDYGKFLKPFSYYLLEELELLIDPKQEAFGKYTELKITLKSERYPEDVAFLIIYHEILHCIFSSLSIAAYFRDSVSGKEKRGIPNLLINIIQDMLFDYQMKIKYGSLKEAWEFLNKSDDKYITLEKIHDQLINFIKKNKMDTDFVDLDKIQKEVLEEFREEIINTYGRGIKYEVLT